MCEVVFLQRFTHASCLIPHALSKLALGLNASTTVRASWKPLAIIAAAAAVVLSLLFLPACCCVKGPASAVAAPSNDVSEIGKATFVVPGEAEQRGPTQTQMQNVDFRLTPSIALDIHRLRGEMQSKDAGTPLNFDNKTSFVLRIDTGEIGLTTPSLDALMNGYVFNTKNSPLRNLHITIAGKQIKQEGIIHKVVDLPFTMWADVSVSNGLLRLHPTKIDICGVNGLGLLKALGQSLEKMIGKDLPKEHGVTADGNDMLLDPEKMLPPPETKLTLVDVHTAGDELVQVFDAGQKLAPLAIPHEEKNYMYFRGGTLRMGKLLMVDADMEVADTDPGDAFEFFLDRYNEQLVAGFTRNQVNYGLVVYMRDFDDLGKPPRAGERLAP
jgi:hypothetical protein